MRNAPSSTSSSERKALNCRNPERTHSFGPTSGPTSTRTNRVNPVMRKTSSIIGVGVRMTSVPPTRSRRAAPSAITASPDASMKYNPARSSTTE